MGSPGTTSTRQELALRGIMCFETLRGISSSKMLRNNIESQAVVIRARESRKHHPLQVFAFYGRAHLNHWLFEVHLRPGQNASTV